MADLYDHPKYYDIAFSYRDIPKEVDVFEECIRRFAKTPVKRMLELCCGPAPHMVELVKRGYQWGWTSIPRWLRMPVILWKN